jgi:hypothetical protein
MHFHGPATDTDKNITDSETPKLQTLCVKKKEKVGDEDIPHFESYADNDPNRTQKDWNMYGQLPAWPPLSSVLPPPLSFRQKNIHHAIHMSIQNIVER